MKYNRLVHIFLLICIIYVGNIHAESIRGTTIGFLSDDGGHLSFLLEDAVVIKTHTVPNHQEGVELQIEIPEELKRYQNSFALFLYKNISPAPEIDKQFYIGTRVYMGLMSSMGSMFLRIPFNKNHTISGDALTHLLPIPVKPEEFPLLATILPIVKGIPESVYKQSFIIRSSVLWKNEGTATVTLNNLSGFSEEIVVITIDGNEVVPNEAVTLSAGIHTIIVSSTHAPIVERTVAIEPGKHMDVPISLDYRLPEVTIRFPKGSRVLLDGKELTLHNTVFTLEIEPGDHEVKGILGEYEISKRFSIRPGDQISIELLINIEIIEYGNESGNPFGAGDR